MSSESTEVMGMDQMDSVELVSLCAQDPADTGLWTEFLRRFGPKIKTFIARTLRTGADGVAIRHPVFRLDAAQESDLFQNTIVRLVENDCAALRRFSGATETELLAYLAVISRSVVRDSFRRQHANKRIPWFKRASPDDVAIESSLRNESRRMELTLLGRELAEMSLKAIRDFSAEPERDALIFQLYYYDGLSTSQIAASKGIELSKTGVEKALNRLRERVRDAAEAMGPVEASKL